MYDNLQVESRFCKLTIVKIHHTSALYLKQANGHMQLLYLPVHLNGIT